MSPIVSNLDERATNLSEKSPELEPASSLARVYPSCNWTQRLSNDRQLVYTRPAQPKLGLAIAILGPLLGLTTLGLLFTYGGTVVVENGPTIRRFQFYHWLPLLLGAGLTLLAPLIGLGICSSSQLVLDKDAGQLTRSWRWLGLSGSSRSPLGEPVSVGWTRKQETTQSSGSSPPTTKTTYPVRLRTEGVRPIPDLFTPGNMDEARALHHEDCAFFEIPEHHWDEQVKDPSSEVARQLVQKQAAEVRIAEARRSGTGGRSTD